MSVAVAQAPVVENALGGSFVKKDPPKSDRAQLSPVVRRLLTE
jgi:hypothetical protein